MPRMSSAARDAARQVQVIAADASNGAALAARLLAALEPAVGFDDAEVIAVDPDSLLFTRLLAYRGDRLPHFAFFLRDVYLVAREPDWLSFPRLLREGGGAAVFHERFELWLRAHPPAMSQSAFTAFWRAQQSPPGGGLRPQTIWGVRDSAYCYAVVWEDRPVVAGRGWLYRGTEALAREIAARFEAECAA